MAYTENTIRELVENNFVYQLLSDKLDIPPGDHSKTFEQVCLEKNMSPKLIETLVKAYDDSSEFPYHESNDLTVLELVEYLQRSHKFYLGKKLPEIEQTAVQVFNKYNESHPLFAFLCLFFTDYKKRIEQHIKFEEDKLFPYVNNLIKVDSMKASRADIFFVLNSFSTCKFIQNHSHIEDELQEVRKIILKYSPQENLPLPYKVFLNQLHYFEVELTKHAIIEDEVLIPKVIELEAHLLKKAASMSFSKRQISHV